MDWKRSDWSCEVAKVGLFESDAVEWKCCVSLEEGKVVDTTVRPFFSATKLELTYS